MSMMSKYCSYQRLPKMLFSNVVFIGIVATYFLLVLNYPLIEHMVSIYQKSNESASDGLSLGFLIFSLVAVGLLLYAIFLILFSWRYVLKPGLIIITLIGAMCALSTVKYGIIFDQDMIRNFIQTNSAEAFSYLSFDLVLSYTLLGIIPSIIIATAAIHYPQGLLRSMLVRLGVIVGALALAALIIFSYYHELAFVGRSNSSLKREINPTTIVYSTYKVIKLDYFTTPPEPVYLGEDAQIVSKRTGPMAMILVLGETGRAANYQYRGYKRETNEFTKGLPLFNFNKVTSCGTATARSVPCMFSNLTRETFKDELVVNRDNILDVLKKAGVDITWIDNQSDCKGVCKRVKVINIKPEPSKSCLGNRCYDSILAEKAAPLLKDIQQDTLIAVHIMGSHGPRYFERYPEGFEKFTPACNRADVENCSAQDVVNTYDNTIRYTDYVISELYKALEQSSAEHKALLYISDHGESLGENGLFLHGLPYAVAPDFQKEIPLQMYLSTAAQKDLSLDSKCLTERSKNDEFSHDNLFHTLLGIFDVATKDYDPKLDILRNCRTSSSAQ